MQPTLQDIKEALRVTHTDDDQLLCRLLQSATLEYLRYRRRENDSEPVTDSSCAIVVEVSSSEEDPFPEDVTNGIILLVQADYDGDPEKREIYREAAYNLFIPHRETFVV